MGPNVFKGRKENSHPAPPPSHQLTLPLSGDSYVGARHSDPLTDASPRVHPCDAEGAQCLATVQTLHLRARWVLLGRGSDEGPGARRIHVRPPPPNHLPALTPPNPTSLKRGHASIRWGFSHVTSGESGSEKLSAFLQVTQAPDFSSRKMCPSVRGPSWISQRTGGPTASTVGSSGPRKFQARETETEREERKTDSVQREVLSSHVSPPHNVRDPVAPQSEEMTGKGGAAL